MFPDPSFVLSASRDATVRLWKLLSAHPPTYDSTLIQHGSAFINSLAYVPPSAQYQDGLIVSGGKDTVIEARQPGKAPQDNADGLLLGHAANVCALDVSEDGKTIVSGGWDAEARIWQVGHWDEATAVLTGHEGSVWAVLAYDKETIITGTLQGVEGRGVKLRQCTTVSCRSTNNNVYKQAAPTNSYVSSTPLENYYGP